jgi:hypothetical protein
LTEEKRMSQLAQYLSNAGGGSWPPAAADSSAVSESLGPVGAGDTGVTDGVCIRMCLFRLTFLSAL